MNHSERKVIKSWKGHDVRDGAGVKIRRVFANYETGLTDPFLLLDNFGSDNPDDYMMGFPWHPHRGIETVTYMISGEVEHGDSMGNKGVIRSGDVQWMTAGGGIIHQEMPKKWEGMMSGFQLWVNLPAKSKMMEPRYRGIESKDMPVVENNGSKAIIVAGKYKGQEGPARNIIADPLYMDITLEPDKMIDLETPKKHTAMAYIFEGSGHFHGHEGTKSELLLFSEGNHITVKTEKKTVRFLFLAGKPLREPIAWGGPIVMNTEKELERAFQEYENGTFIKK
jgi:quercetin 2,3-dioxygenase